MHFSIPDTTELTDKSTPYTVFNLHINGAYHCSVRYSLFHNFHEQLKKEFGVQSLPSFPPKKLLSLNSTQLEERRAGLERYIQVLSQNPQIATSSTFNSFLLQVQQESQQEVSEPAVLHVYLVNSTRLTVNITSTDQTDAVLESVAAEVKLPDDFVYYFALYLVSCDEEDNEFTIVRKLQEFESPYISLKAANQNGRHLIVLRKSYWDPSYDDDLIANRITMNLLYIQAVADVDKSWVLATKEEHKQLDSLQQKGSKKEYLRFCRTLKYYSYLQFPPCPVDYPSPACQAIVSAGNKELNLRIQVEPDVMKEISFRVTRMRCWRITTTLPESSSDPGDSNHSDTPQLELAFEYLIARDTMQWVTIYSDQAIVMSMCLQGMVDELVMKKEGRRFKKPADRQRRSQSTNQKRDSTPQSPTSPLQLPSPTTEAQLTNGSSSSKVRSVPTGSGDRNPLPTRFLGSRVNATKATTSENSAFEGIGDDDL